jgi:cell wall-associated NlpC family hydrolase
MERIKTMELCARSSLALMGVSVLVVACSTVAGRAPEPGRALDVRGPEREGPEVGARAPQAEALAPRPSAWGQRAAAVALKYRGVPYRWGGTEPSGFDCSGFVQHVYAKVGLKLPRSAAQQYEHGTPVSRDSLRPGDLVFFDRLRHNGIYIGHGRFIHAGQTGKRVSVADLDDEWYRTRWAGARRL